MCYPNTNKNPEVFAYVPYINLNAGGDAGDLQSLCAWYLKENIQRETPRKPSTNL